MFGDQSQQNEHVTIFLSIPKQKLDVLEMFDVLEMAVYDKTAPQAPVQ